MMASIDFRSLPKAEIHIHLEGCFGAQTIVNLARENGEALPRPQDQLLDFTGLADFLEFLDFICGLSRTKDHLAKAAYAFSQRMAGSGVGYSDLIVNPTHWSGWQGNLAGLIEGLDAGLSAAEQDGLPPTGLCVSLLRQQSSEEAIAVVEELLRLKHPRVVALSVDGNEAASGRTGPKFAHAFQMAGRGGLKRTAHAGESSGAEGVRDAVFLLGVDRIDHGVRAIEDAELLDILADRQIALGICPTSNLTLGLYKEMAEHPIDLLRRAGVPVSINTDDPALLKLDLPTEYQRTASAFGWDRDICRSVAETSIKASFASDDIKGRLLGELAAW